MNEQDQTNGAQAARGRKRLWAVLAALFVVAALVAGGLWLGDEYRQWQEVQDLHMHLSGTLRHVRFHSQVLGMDKDFLIYLPPGYNAPENQDRRYPTVYLLHGCPGQARDWVVKGEAHLTVERMILKKRIEPIIMVFPDLEGPRGTFDCNGVMNRADGKWPAEDYFLKDVVQRVDDQYRTIRDPERRGLAGLSMGGFAAVNLTVKHPDIFAVACSISGYFKATDYMHIVNAVAPGRPDLWAQNDPYDNIAGLPERNRLHIYLDCGADDIFLPQNRAFAAKLKALGVDSELHVSPGAHTYKFWAQQLQNGLLFMDSRFRRQSTAS